MTEPAAAGQAAAAARFTVDPWDPGYGQAFSDEAGGGSLQESSAELDLDTELPAGRWRPVDPDLAAARPATVLFLDGIRRIDARIWVHSGLTQGGLRQRRRRAHHRRDRRARDLHRGT